MKKLALLFFVVIPFFSISQIINIPDDYPTIQQGIDVAVSGDTILVQPGMYLENINFLGKNITVASLFLTTQDTTYISQTIIDGDQSGTVVTFENGESQDAILSGFTITNGYSSTSGGAISCVYSSNPHLENLIITANSALYNGGGIICGADASPSLEDVLITNNSAGADGGGVYCFNYSSPIFENVVIAYNVSSYNGGGICCLQNCPLNLNNVTLLENSAHQGGGILSAFNSSLNLSNVFVVGNSATEGGGILCIESDIVLDNILAVDNYADKGGVIHATNSNIYCSDADFSNNDAGIDGGVLYYISDDDVSNNYNIEISNSTFEDNSAIQTTAGIRFRTTDENVSHTNIKITNSSFSNNFADRRGCIYISGEGTTFNVTNTEFISNEVETYVGAVSLSYSCQGSFIGCLFQSNNASIGGGNYNSGAASVWSEASADFINCTFVNNTAAYGSALTIGGGGIANSINCIYWGKSNSQIALDTYNDMGVTLTVDYCKVQDGTNSIDVSSLSTLNYSYSNIDQEPQFINSGIYPYQINDNSPCINAGIPDTTGLDLPEYDLAGEERIFENRVDMGVYEWNTFVGINESSTQTSGLNVQIYPNPATTTTTIEYELQQSATTQIFIYNHLGKMVDVIQLKQSAGKQQIVWNATGQANGMYYLRIKAGNYVASGKLIVAR